MVQLFVTRGVTMSAHSKKRFYLLKPVDQILGIIQADSSRSHRTSRYAGAGRTECSSKRYVSEFFSLR